MTRGNGRLEIALRAPTVGGSKPTPTHLGTSEKCRAGQPALHLATP